MYFPNKSSPSNPFATRSSPSATTVNRTLFGHVPVNVVLVDVVEVVEVVVEVVVVDVVDVVEEDV